jgi:hypothetical protein
MISLIGIILGVAIIVSSLAWFCNDPEQEK